MRKFVEDRRSSAVNNLYIEQFILYAKGISSNNFGIISKLEILSVQICSSDSSLHSIYVRSTNTLKNRTTFSLTQRKSEERYYKYPTYCPRMGNTLSCRSSKLATDRSMLVRTSYADFYAVSSKKSKIVVIVQKTPSCKRKAPFSTLSFSKIWTDFSAMSMNSKFDSFPHRIRTPFDATSRSRVVGCISSR